MISRISTVKHKTYLKFNTHDGMSGAGSACPVGRPPGTGGAPPPILTMKFIHSFFLN
jgi:hypothetical protein